MKNTNPKKTLDKAEKILNAFEQLAPEKSFGGIKVNQFTDQVNLSRNARAEIQDLEDQKTQAVAKRDNADEQMLNMVNLIVNGVVGDPEFGPDSALYEAMGYVRKSNRKSGLTRKKKASKPTT